MATPLPPPPAVIGYSEGLALRPLPGVPAPAAQDAPAVAPAGAPAAKPAATETLAQRTGALVNEVDFPGFVSQLVNGTFDAIVDASIRQMESYSTLVASVAKTVDQFTEENVTPNQARDWLAQRYPGEVTLQLPTPENPTPILVPRAEGLMPIWLADYGIANEELTSELLETQVLPQVRLKVGGERQQLLAAMVTLGLNRVAVKDGSITAKVMFRAAASDVAKVGYAAGSDPAQQAQGWGQRGSQTYATGNTMVSTLAVNAQNDTNLRADLFGEVKLNFVSETLPLDKLADMAKIAMVQRNLPGMQQQTPAPVPTPAVSAPAAPEAGGGG
ncbi:hypothetical protein [Chitinolyticbacter albus]|uniref:hypothetical protein n=1 Tax=Chitinolyticbacter albus TaxID=2961951 RepID=UPI00210BBF76|nr:hypothetical protein [Chitinolyticbacter albus]